MTVQFTPYENTLGALAMVLTIAAMLPYARETFLGHIRPHRATWLVWALLASLSASAQIASGSGPALWFAATQAGGTLLIAAMALRSGRGKLASATEILVIALAGFGFVLWQLTSEPAYALVISISISACAAIPTILKSFADPASESLVPWTLKLAASICAVIVAAPAGPVMLAYPVYLAVLYSSILVALAFGYRRMAIAVAPAMAG